MIRFLQRGSERIVWVLVLVAAAAAAANKRMNERTSERRQRLTAATRQLESIGELFRSARDDVLC